MARPLGNAYASREPTIEDLRDAFLAHAHAKNLAPRTIEWYERHTGAFRDWCAAHGMLRRTVLPFQTCITIVSCNAGSRARLTDPVRGIHTHFDMIVNSASAGIGSTQGMVRSVWSDGSA